jgi:hypothetical protein
MTAIVLPDLDFDELRKRIPALAEIELPSMQDAGRRADEAIDRVLGRPRMSIWPWIAGFVAVAIVGSIVAMVGWNRRSVSSEPTDFGSMTPEPTGLSHADGSLMTSPADRL